MALIIIWNYLVSLFVSSSVWPTLIWIYPKSNGGRSVPARDWLSPEMVLIRIPKKKHQTAGRKKHLLGELTHRGLYHACDCDRHWGTTQMLYLVCPWGGGQVVEFIRGFEEFNSWSEPVSVSFATFDLAVFQQCLGMSEPLAWARAFTAKLAAVQVTELWRHPVFLSTKKESGRNWGALLLFAFLQ